MTTTAPKPLNPRELEATLAEVSRALETRAPEQAWAKLAPLAPHLTSDRELASAWLTLLRITPKREGLAEDVRRVLERWPADLALLMSGCDALIRNAELRAPDEPPPEGGPADSAVAHADRALASLDAAQSARADVAGYLHTIRANGLRLAHRYERALEAAQRALALDPKNAEWQWNLALVHKALQQWQPALDAISAAQAAGLGERKGVLWNIAICATALGRGALAVEALQKLGFPAQVAASGMPYVENMPPVQVRVATRASGHGVGQTVELEKGVAFELVWVTPASPVHGVVQSTTHRDASVDYGDLVLWDGTPISVGELEGKPVPRFPLLSVLRRGDERRFRFVALEQDDGDALAFGKTLPNDALFFAHHAKVEQLCARCASGDHMRKHEHTALEPHRLVYGKIVVPADVDLSAFQAALGAHLRTHPKVHFVMPGLYEALGQTEAAGKAHQLWRGLEKTAIKTGKAAPQA